MPQTKTQPQDDPSPAALRSVFGRNLRQLTENVGTVSQVSRDLGMNRTQFNRYLSGESFPRPDQLHRICRYFGVDARILLEPIDRLRWQQGNGEVHPELEEFVPDSDRGIPQEVFPDGIYRFSRPSFLFTHKFVQGLVLVYRSGGHTFIRGYELRGALQEQGLPETPSEREFRGQVLARDGGIAAMISRRSAATCTFNFLTRVPSFENNYWVGYVARTAGETLTGRRVARMVYEHLGHKRSEIARAARSASFCNEDDLLPYHRQLLNAGMPFR